MRGIRPLFRRRFDAVRIRPRQGLVHAGRKRPLSSVAGVATCQLHPPPFNLPAPYFERPTPILLVQGEGCEALGAAAWGSMVPFLNSRGCSVGTLDYGAAHSNASLAELEQLIVSAVRALAAGPPVIIAHSAMAFIAQKFLESHAARGMILLDPFPPSPAARASRLLTELNKTTSKSSSTTIPWKALEEMRDPANAVKLEPGAVPMLLVYTSKGPTDGEHAERQAMAAFHAVAPEDVHTLALPSRHVAGDGQGTQRPIWAVLSEAVGAGFDSMAYDWYDERF